MKKKLALLLAGVMALSMVPMTAFAKTTNRISNVVVASVDDTLTTDAPVLKMYGDDLETGMTTQAFQLTLTNAEWNDLTTLEATLAAQATSVAVTQLTAKSIVVEVSDVTNTIGSDVAVEVPMLVELTAKGDATVTVNPRESVFSAGEYKFATVTDGDVAVSVEGIRSVAEKATRALKTIVLEETVEGTLEDGVLKLRLTKDWSFVGTDGNVADLGFAAYPVGAATVTDVDFDGRDAYITLNVDEAATKAIVITLAPTVQWDYDEVEAGDICEMVLSGAGVDKTTLEVAKAISYGVTWTAEDKALPEIYWGTEGEALDVTLEETIANSWLEERTTKIVFSEGVKATLTNVTTTNASYVGDALIANDDNDVFTFGNWTTSGAAEITFTFDVDVKPGFTGDITATLTGKGVEEDMEATIATAIAPVTVEVEKSDIVLDYRHTAIGDIVITEAEAGILPDGEVIALQIERLEFDDEPEAEVVAGDITIEDTWVRNGVLYIEIDDESVKEASTIKVTGASLYMERDIPAGDYYLRLTNGTNAGGVAKVNALFKNTLWTTSNVKVANDYVSVVTAGRDVDDSTFTTTLEVTVGATEMKANDKAIALDVPAYISGGYTMLPVRAITEALSGTAIVRWDDVAKQVTITFGSRVIAMTVGSDVMTINGVEVPMLAKCEITDSRAFIPLRDMGYALGLNDTAINWNAETNTATLN